MTGVALTPALSRKWERGQEGPDQGTAVIGALDWRGIERDLDAYGCAVAPKLISPEACAGSRRCTPTTPASARAS
jgi:hypothetical protein